MRKISILVLLILIQISSYALNKFTINGHIKDIRNGEMLIGGNVFIKELKTGAVANLYGFYSISLPQGKYTVLYSYIGYNSITKTIDLTNDITLDIELEPKAKNLNEIVITTKKGDENISSTQMSAIKLDANTIKSIPAMLGEVDVLKAIQLLPGVQVASEGMSGFSVRGGNLDQNLILIDEATVYNSSHLMGFVSVFNNDAIKDIKLYKGDIPAEYGGRLSSLVDVRMRDGNMKKFSVTGGIGTISSRLTVEGPLKKDVSSFIISCRRSYADLFLLASSDFNKSKLHFYDFNFKFNYIINSKNRLYLSSYSGRDIFSFQKIYDINWGNSTKTVRWNQLISKKLFSNYSLILSNYDYKLGMRDESMDFNWKAKMKDYSLKTDFSYYLNSNNSVKFGFVSTFHQFNPGNISLMVDKQTAALNYQISKSLEHAVFISNEHKIDSLFSLDYGFRFSVFQRIGADTVYVFDENYDYIDKAIHKKGEVYNAYFGFEPRLGAKYKLSEKTSIKACYSRTRQYLHLATSSTGGIPMDLWLPSSKIIKPQIADMFALGLFKNLKHDIFETSLEVYYKNMKNEVDFKDNAELMLNPLIEGELRFGKAKSYGAELMLRKQEGKLNGWISYTWSRAFRIIKEINKGLQYSANYDKPHNISVALNYSLSKRLSISTNWVYMSGSPVTFPTGRFEYMNELIPVVSERNSYRFPDYHRLDIGLTLKNKEKNKKYNWDLNFSVYNVYNRKNVWYVKLDKDSNIPNKINATIKYFPFMPSLTYNFHF